MQDRQQSEQPEQKEVKQPEDPLQSKPNPQDDSVKKDKIKLDSDSSGDDKSLTSPSSAPMKSSAPIIIPPLPLGREKREKDGEKNREKEVVRGSNKNNSKNSDKRGSLTDLEDLESFVVHDADKDQGDEEARQSIDPEEFDQGNPEGYPSGRPKKSAARCTFAGLVSGSFNAAKTYTKTTLIFMVAERAVIEYGPDELAFPYPGLIAGTGIAAAAIVEKMGSASQQSDLLARLRNEGDGSAVVALFKYGVSQGAGLVFSTKGGVALEFATRSWWPDLATTEDVLVRLGVQAGMSTICYVVYKGASWGAMKLWNCCEGKKTVPDQKCGENTYLVQHLGGYVMRGVHNFAFMSAVTFVAGEAGIAAAANAWVQLGLMLASDLVFYKVIPHFTNPSRAKQNEKGKSEAEVILLESIDSSESSDDEENNVVSFHSHHPKPSVLQWYKEVVLWFLKNALKYGAEYGGALAVEALTIYLLLETLDGEQENTLLNSTENVLVAGSTPPLAEATAEVIKEVIWPRVSNCCNSFWNSRSGHDKLRRESEKNSTREKAARLSFSGSHLDAGTRGSMTLVAESMGAKLRNSRVYPKGKYTHPNTEQVLSEIENSKAQGGTPVRNHK